MKQSIEEEGKLNSPIALYRCIGDKQDFFFYLFLFSLSQCLFGGVLISPFKVDMSC